MKAMHPFDLDALLGANTITASAPCRIDMGGTLDIGTFHYPLHRLHPATVNLAICLRTRITLASHTPGRIKVSSRGFDSVDIETEHVPFDHPMGLIFAIIAFFGVSGIHVKIDSASPPKSGMGGSSVVAVALVAALARLEEMQGKKSLTRSQIALLAHAIEAGVAMVPCGYQDQLAAAYGGINEWEWRPMGGLPFRRRIIIKKRRYRWFQPHLLVAYSGVPHVSSDVNGKWIRQFISGKFRNEWKMIIRHTRLFSRAMAGGDIPSAVTAMNTEVDIRRQLTPEVLDEMGIRLVASARENGCGARFTGAGGGGCLWALGDVAQMESLRHQWTDILSIRPDACLLDHRIDPKGVEVRFRDAGFGTSG